MKVNIGRLDRLLRIAVGVLFICLSVFGIIGWWGYLGIILVLTGLISFCPIYTLLGLNTSPKE